MNKSLLTNVIALLVILIGYFVMKMGESQRVIAEYLLSAGYFSLSGALTNWLAIYMLFERIPGIYGSGVIPLNFEKFKAAIRTMMMEQFFTEENLESFLNSGISTEILDDVDYNKGFDGLKSEILSSSLGGMLGMFGGEAALESFRPAFTKRLKEFATEALSEKLEGGNGGSEEIHRQIGSVIDQRLDELTPQEVKQIIQEMIRQHLGWLVVWGGLFGGLIGIIKEATNVLF